MLNTNGLSRDQEMDLVKRIEVYRFQNRNGADEAQCDQAAAGPMSGHAHELVRDRNAENETKAVDPRRAGSSRLFVTEEVSLENVDQIMAYQPWTPDQIAAGDVVRETLIAAVRAILRVVPRCANRTKAINHLIDARMDANAAISFRGRF